MERNYTLNEWLKQTQSEVQKNRAALRVGDVLHYVDSFNCQKWTVTEVSNTGFVAVSVEESEQEAREFYFAHLQKNWTISQKSKDFNIAHFRTKYL